MERDRAEFVESIVFLGVTGLASLLTVTLFPPLPPGEIDVIVALGEGTTAISFLVAIGAMYWLRSDIEPKLLKIFGIGFGALFVSTLLGFLSELVAVPLPATHFVKEPLGIIGSLSLALGFATWVKLYQERGEILTTREEELAQRNEKLEVLNRIISHDIKNDLNAVHGMIGLAEPYTEGEGKEYLEHAKSSTMDAVGVTDTASEFVSALSNEADPELQPVPLLKTLREQVTQTKQNHPDAEVTLNGHVEDEVMVPASAMLPSVFRNLMTNAVRHNDKDTPKVNVSVDVDQDDVLVTVADNGPGIPSNVETAIFDHGEKSMGSPGTGIGLYLVKKIVSQCNGDVWTADADTEGAAFTVSLPKSNRGTSLSN